MQTRRSALLTVGSLIGLCGCNRGTGGITENPSRQPEHVGDETQPSYPDYRTVKVENRALQPQEVDIEVSRDGEILHDGTHNISIGKTQLIYNTSSDGLGNASIVVKATTNSDNVTKTNSGLDQPLIYMEPHGNVSMIQ